MHFRVKKDENCNIYYDDLLNFLDRSKCPMADTIPINVKVIINEQKNACCSNLIRCFSMTFTGVQREMQRLEC